MSEARYEIKEQIGEGGAGTVFIAHDTRLDREVALKRLSAEEGGWSQDTVEIMLKEARLLSSISHPNIVTIYDADVDDDGPYVVMELLKGENVDSLIAENTLTASDFEDFATQCLGALVAAHSYDLIHRDIKPNNIVLKWLPSGQFQAKLLDFGMAKLTKEPSKQTVDQTDSVYGSIFFMAPEQFERIELDARTDLYALGSVFYYTLTGVYPFTGESPAEVMTSHLSHRVKPVAEYRPDLPLWLSNWVMWLINRSMEHRPKSAQEALDLFNSNLRSEPLKITSAVSTKIVSGGEGHYFGQSTSDDSVFNNEAAKNDNAEELAPVLLNTDGQLILQGREPSAAPAETVTQAPLATGVAPPVVTQPVLMAPSSTPESTEPTPASSPTTKNELDKAKSKTSGLIALLSIIVIALVVGAALLVMSLKKQKENVAINRILQPALEDQTDIPTTAEETKTLLSQLYTISGKFDNELIYRRLSFAKSSDSSDLDAQIANFAIQKDGLLPGARKALFKVLSIRESDSVGPKLYDFIKTNENESVVVSALSSFKKIGSDTDIDFLLDQIKTTTSSSKRSAAEGGLASIIKKSKSPQAIANKLSASFTDGQGALTKASINRLLGLVGGDSAKESILEGLASGNRNDVIPALSSLAGWKDGTLTQDVIDFWVDSSDKQLRDKAFSTIISLTKAHHLNNEGDLEILTQITQNLSNPQEKTKTINLLTASKKKFVIPLIKPFAKDKNKTVSNRAERAISRLEEK